MNVGRIAELTTPTPAATPKSSAQQAAKKDNTTAADRPHVDKFEDKNEATYTPAYTKKSGKTQSETASDNDKGVKVNKPKSTTAMKNEAFTSMVRDIIGKQGGAAYNAIMKDAYRTLAGDDDSKLETLRDAVKKGFAQAGQAFSKKYGQKGLPSICQDTYNKVMDKFDDWAKESKGTTGTASTSSDKKSTFTPSGYSVTNPKYNPDLRDKKAD